MPEESLVCHQSAWLRLVAWREAFFHFNALVQPVAPPATFHRPAAHRVNDHNLAISHLSKGVESFDSGQSNNALWCTHTDQVRGVTNEKLLRLQRVPDELCPRILRVEHGFLQKLLALIVALFAERDTLANT